MEKNPLQSYLFAAIDFMINQSGEWFFIEANSWPGAMREAQNIAKTSTCRPLEALLKSIHTSATPLTIHYVETTKYLTRHKTRPIFVPKYYEHHPTVKNFVTHEIPSTEDTILADWYSRNKEALHNGVILTRFIAVKKILEEHGLCNVINPFSVSALTLDKFRISTALKSNPYFLVPKTFLCKTNHDVLHIMQEHKLTHAVLKPRYGQKGAGVLFIDQKNNNNLSIDWSGDWILQEQINTPQKGDAYWDIRANVINGHFSDSFMRVSKNRVVNLAQGGRATSIPKELEKKVQEAAEACVSMINSVAYKK